MTGDTISAVAHAFEWHAGRTRDEQWLPAGTSHIIRALLEFDGVSEETLWAVALLLTVMEKGGTCLPLDSIPRLDETQRLPEELRSLTAGQWQDRLSGGAVGNGHEEADPRPLVLAHGRLYFDRLFRLERDVALRLLTPLGEGALPEPANWRETVSSIFGDSDVAARQREVALGLFEQRVSILAGGPGTGKTHTVAQLLVALHRAAKGKAAVRLCAPTGKAAKRIAESLQKVIRDIDPDAARELSDLIAPTTIHKLLGVTPLTTRRRHAEPLHVDLVVCDETSMVDLSLFDELLRSLSDHTRVLLVGDPNQLQSVDVGTVMSDLVEAMGNGLPGVTLEHVFRLDVNEDLSDARRQQILKFFDAVRNGQVHDALNLLDSGSDFLSHIEVDDEGELPDDSPVIGRVLARATRLRELAYSADEDERRAALQSTMVLAAQHRGNLGREWWVDLVADKLGARVNASPNWPGLPVLITANDYVNGVTNGDTGLIVMGEKGQPVFWPTHQAAPADAEGTTAGILSPTAVHDWQAWWAMTIHKSQGSEFDSVIVSITPKTRLLSRELLYTAVTRAQSQVIIVGRRTDIAYAIEKEAERYSGLADILRAELKSRA